MLIDDVKIKISAGDGGRGAVGFNKIKGALGPTGASGGTGGDVYLEGVSDIGALNQFRYKKELVAEKGKDGDKVLHDGAGGNDLILKVPVGTVIHYVDMETNLQYEIIKIGERVLIAKGGNGGKGNFLFRSSRNTTPKQFQYGLLGQEVNLRLELKLIADIGFVGLPNVGKTSLLNELTKAKSKVANYPFTTLEPNIGAYYDLILADIPGLIEGASRGKGLGIKFLRHIERTKILFHFISADSEDVIVDYNTIKNELGLYKKELIEKEEYIFLSKSDSVTKEELKGKIDKLKKINKNIIPISIYDDESIEKVKKILGKIMKEK